MPEDRESLLLSRGEEQILCPVCRKPRVRSQMQQHIGYCHTHEGHVKAQEKGYKRGGKGRRQWWKTQIASQW